MFEQVEITALMLYYGRRNGAEEAVECFMRQTYPHKRLVIVNTHPDPVWFEDNHRNIEIHNIIPGTFANLNAKYNYAFRQIKTNWWCPWDDDDLWLPWHFENIVAGVPQKKGPDPLKVGIPTCYFADDNVINRIGWNMWGNCIYESYDKDGKLYPGCDASIEKNCDRQTLLDKEWTRCWLRTAPKSFIFRWDQNPHESAYKGEEAAHFRAKWKKKMYATRNTDPFQPHWDRDYVKDVEEFEATQAQRSKDEVSCDLRS
jgi:hypothetical protein